MRKLFTVWLFKAPLSGESVRVALAYQPDDLRLQHPFQTVLWQGYADDRIDAFRSVNGVVV